MRLFTGISLNDDNTAQLEQVLDELRPAADLRWSPASNLHITTAFIGKWDEGRLPELIAALSQVRQTGPVPVTLTGFGYFPNPHHPHPFFVAARQEPTLMALAKNIETALVSVGYQPEDRPWHPHVTLARIARENITQLRFRTAAMNTLFPLPGFAATAFHLYESRPGPTGSVYSKLHTFPLEASAR